MVQQWELNKLENWSTNKIRNAMWLDSIGHPIEGCISRNALKEALIIRGEDPTGYHET